MIHFRKILIIGIIEILIGGSTFLSTIVTLVLGSNQKPSNVLLFVTVSSLLSAFIGYGILKFKKIAYQLLLYFSSVVILSKILIFLGILQLSGDMVTAIPGPVKNFISVCYHGFVLYYLRKEPIKRIFHD